MSTSPGQRLSNYLQSLAESLSALDVGYDGQVCAHGVVDGKKREGWIFVGRERFTGVREVACVYAHADAPAQPSVFVVTELAAPRILQALFETFGDGEEDEEEDGGGGDDDEDGPDESPPSSWLAQRIPGVESSIEE